tara:strand:+ start:250 stop:1629 length:1380 start_codon:yes stop_codon:yes gene_type:complete
LKIKNINPILAIFLLGIFLEALDAFSFLSIPLPWIGLSLLISSYVFNYFFGFNYEFNELPSLRIWIFYLFIVTIFRALSFDQIMPEYTTTTFSQFISLRLLKLIGFIVAIWAVHLINVHLRKEKIIEYIVYVGLLISLLSLYSYFSYVFDFPDFNRTRAGSGGWSQPIRKACSILRNYGTFREPSFLAVWLAPTIILIFALARKKNSWYFVSVIPILSLVLTRSLTGVIGIVFVILIVSLIWIFKKKSVNINLVIPIIIIFMTSVFANNLSFKFPALDPSMCPPNTPDYCNCSIYDDEIDEVKNSEEVTGSIFSRADLIISGGLNSFSNIAYINEYMNLNGVKLFGEGIGIANINYSFEYEDLSNRVIERRVRFSNPGQVVSFNNLYANILFSSGLLGFIWFSIILYKLIIHLVKRFSSLDVYLLSYLLLILLMYFFQGEELSISLGIAIGLATTSGKD